MSHHPTQPISLKPSKQAWLVWGLGALLFFSDYFVRVSPSVMVPDLMRAFNADAVSIGALASYFYIAYVCMQMPVGVLFDKFGLKKLLVVMALIVGLMCFLFASSETLGLAYVARFFTGFAAAFAFVGALKLAFRWFPPNYFGMLAGATQALGMLGASVGDAPVAFLVHHFGWRMTLVFMGIFLIVLAILIALIVKDKPDYSLPHIEENADKISIVDGLKIILRNPQTWINGMIIGCLFAPTAVLAEMWGPTFLEVVHGLPQIAAAAAIGMIFLGWGVGGPLFGFLSDRAKQRKPFMLLSIVVCLIIVSLVLYVTHLPKILLFALLFIYGVMNMGVAIGYVIAAEINPAKVAATSMAFANMASIAIGAALMPVVGKLINYFHHGIAVSHLDYQAADFQKAFFILPLVLLISLLLSLKLRESFPDGNI